MNNIYSSQPISIKHYDAEDKRYFKLIKLELSEEKIEIIFEVRKNEIGNLGIYINEEKDSCEAENIIYNTDSPSNNGIIRIKITEKFNENKYKEGLDICLTSHSDEEEIFQLEFISISPTYKDKIEYEREQTNVENIDYIMTNLNGISSKIILEFWSVLERSYLQDPQFKLTKFNLYYSSINNNYAGIGSSKGKEIAKEKINLDYVELYFCIEFKDHGKFSIHLSPFSLKKLQFFIKVKENEIKFPKCIHKLFTTNTINKKEKKLIKTIMDDEIKGNKQTKQLYLNKITKQITKEENILLKNLKKGISIFVGEDDFNDDNKEDLVKFIDVTNSVINNNYNYQSIGGLKPLFNDNFIYILYK